ncbi:flagellar basal body-associated protein FliL [Bacillus sp. FJAT-49711]|uniref:flagellar basal body-associated protein FliL n=1 Tax=Bacillus sp. FJAT-49711 TaxID=2833585 RepID=UPI001BCA5558|nr:flagellar basal body-associated protein FliL [Bacillus sp. FJAT-49711]MBS4217743.1 flagellar basal body-associated protein FliL [Bacillus sp. FJAT-49711]
MNKRLFPTMMVLLTAILLLATLALIIIMNLGDKDKKNEPTIDEVIKVSVDVPEIMTNIKNGDYVKISFKVQTNGKKAKDEFQKRDFQIKNLIISELSEMEPTDLDGKDGKQKLEETMKDKINELMQDGKVVRIYITSYVIS